MKKEKKRKWWLFWTIIAILGIFLISMFLLFGNKRRETQKTEEVTYIDPQDLGMPGTGEPEYFPEEDEDNDGLTNQEEDSLGTDVFLADSDGDGVSDYDEQNESNTNPLNPDSDGDGLKDGIELLAGLDPNNKKTGDISDGRQVFEVEYELDNMTLQVNGNANVYGITAEKASITGLNQTPGVIGNVYEFYTDDRFETAKLSISYNEDELEDRGIKPNQLAICQFTNEGKFEKVDSSVVNEDEEIVTAELEHFSKYALCDTGAIFVDATPQVMLLVDNSGSMYSKEYIETSEENDVDFKRVDMSKSLIEMCEDDVEFGLAKFTADYTELAPMGADRDELLRELDSIKTTEETFNGTYLETSLITALESYEKDDNKHRKFVVLLTDGESTEGRGLLSIKWYNEDDIIDTAKEQNVTIITIGLGNSVDRDFLSEVATETGGIYIHASNADALDEVYKAIMAALEYNFVDLDDDGTNDSVMLADSGFSSTDHILNYQNIQFINQDGKIVEGLCYGIAALEQLYYIGDLPLQQDESKKYKDGLLGGEYTGTEYDLENTFFEEAKHEVLSVYENEALQIYRDIHSVSVEKRFDNNDGYLQLKEKYMDMIESHPLLTVKKVECGKTRRYGDWEYDSYDQYYIDISDVDVSELSDSEMTDYQGICMIYRLFVLQFDSNEIEYGIYGDGSYEKNAQEKNMDKLIDTLSSGIPVILSAKHHAVLATAIYRDLENPNKYKIRICDSNSPGDECYITIERKISSKWSLNLTNWVNDYLYTGYDDDGIFGDVGNKISVTISDLSDFYDE